MPRKKTSAILVSLAAIAVTVTVIRTLNPADVASRLELRVPIAASQLPGTAGLGCEVDHPSFYFGFADLRTQLGTVMGAPIECEHAIHVNGDTRQRTTTGYAYYRKSDNIPTFTNGWDHWALTASGLVHWSGYVVDPPGQGAQHD